MYNNYLFIVPSSFTTEDLTFLVYNWKACSGKNVAVYSPLWPQICYQSHLGFCYFLCEVQEVTFCMK